MSTFDGVLEEYPLISIDRFLEPKNYCSTTYFLSHCHKDHMHGLNYPDFCNLLISRGFSKIYVSDVSGHLLRHDEMYQHLSDFLVELRIEEPTLISIYDELGNIHSKITMTLLTAGHCPGSVMFYFEGDNGNVLYTGDFRLPVGSAARLIHLQEPNGRVKPLKSLYIDTTFCSEKCLYIPSREECLNEIVSIVEPWLSQGPNYIVYFLCPYELAYEFVFVELHKRFGLKTHVTDDWKRKYLGIKLLESAITACASEAKIHACILDRNNNSAGCIKKMYDYESPCGFVSSNEKPIYVKKIKPSAMFFTKSNFSRISNFNDETSLHRVFYSTHPSLSEIRDMVRYLNPQKVFPNVVHGQTTEEILDLIFHPHETELVENRNEISESLSISPLGELKCPSPKDASSVENDSLPFFDDCYKTTTEKNNMESSKKRILSYALHVDTDYENTKEQEVMLREEIYSQKMENENCDIKNDSQLKWVNPVLSSDEEVFGPSSDSSLEDKDDSDTYGGSSQETNIKSSFEDNDQIKHRTTCMPPDYHVEISQQRVIKSSFDENNKVEDRNRHIKPSNNSADGSAKSIESESLINEQYVNYYYNNNNKKKNILSDESTFQIDKEYSKISEVDNAFNTVASGINKPKALNFNKNSSKYSQCSDRKIQNISTNQNFIFDSNVKCRNNNVASLSVSQKFKHSEKLETKTESRPGMKYLNVQSTKNITASPPRYLISNDTSSDENESPVLKQDVEYKNECISKFEESPIKTNGNKSKSFHFVKKMNSSSESEDEYDFKYVVKKPPRNNPINSKNFNLKENKPCSSNLAVNSSQNIQLTKKFFREEKNVETGFKENSFVKNKFNQKLPSFATSVEAAKSELTTKFKNSYKVFNNRTKDKYNASENRNMDIDKHSKHDCAQSSSSTCERNHSKESRYGNVMNFHKSLNVQINTESISKNIGQSHFASELMKSSVAVVKPYENNSINIKLQDPNPDFAGMSPYCFSNEIASVNLEKTSDCKNVSNRKKFGLHKIPCIENGHKPSNVLLGTKQPNSSIDSNLTFISNKENTSGAADNLKAQKTAVKHNSNDYLAPSLKNLNTVQPNSTKDSSRHPLETSDSHMKNDPSSVCDDTVLEKFSSSWEIKAVSQSSSNSSVIVEEILLSSDDSPSLIAPNVPKESGNIDSFIGNFGDLKRRKVQWRRNNFSNKNGDCNEIAKKICDNYTVDSDSTPELLENNTLSNNEHLLSKKIPEIIIDDDNDDW